MTASVQRMSANGLVVLVSLACMAVGCHTKPVYDRVGTPRVWKGEEVSGAYEHYVDATMKREGGNVVVTCTMPQLLLGTMRFEVKQISLRYADHAEVAAVENHPTLTGAFSEQQLETLVVHVLYIDEHAFSETITDPQQQVDWSVRIKRFQLVDALELR